MSIVMNLLWEGLTAADYDRVRDEVRFRTDPPAGGRYHIAWFTPEAGRIVENFVTGPVTKALAAMGVDETASTGAVSPLHAWFDPTKVRAHT